MLQPFLYLLSLLFTVGSSAPVFRGGITIPGMTVIPSPTTGANRSTERQPWLVFTSAGDHSAVAQWLAGRHYDIMVVYYGKEPESFPYRDLVDIYRSRTGCKFCNLKYYHEKEPELFVKYSGVAVFDDDIQITSDSLNRLFRIREKYDLWITTPAMKPQYHSPWYDSLAAVSPQTRVRIVPFVEMDCPMFRADKLWNFVDNEFDPIVKGWGTDVWYTEFFGPGLKNKQAVADCVTAVNPPERKNGKREILDYLGSDDDRKKAWLSIVHKKKFQSSTPPNGAGRKGKISDLSWSC